MSRGAPPAISAQQTFERLSEIAIYEGGCLPGELLKLTPGELFLLVNGIRFRQQKEWDRVAALGAWILRGLGDKDVTGEKLLGRKMALAPWEQEQEEDEYKKEKALLLEMAARVEKTIPRKKA